MKRPILRNRRRVATRRAPLKFSRAPNVFTEKAESGLAVAWFVGAGFGPARFSNFDFRLLVLWCAASALPEVCRMKENFWNWMLIGFGGILIVAELLMGAVTGFDLALMGLSLVAGGGVGLYFASTKVGLIASGLLAFFYVVFIRQRLRARMTPKATQPSNVDAILGRSGVVTLKIGPHEAGRVKVGDEEWRAVLAADAGASREPGQTITVVSAEGVTLTVR
jgi:membrane protein implicated in regulation of membrane protease activity